MASAGRLSRDLESECLGHRMRLRPSGAAAGDLRQIHSVTMRAAPQHVAHSTIKNATLNYDPEPAAKACKIPMAYISADVPLVNMARDLDRLQQLCPQLVVAKTLLAGHFNTIEVADQVNAMINRFLAVGLGKKSFEPL
jgi:hypothetical protein